MRIQLAATLLLALDLLVVPSCKTDAPDTTMPGSKAVAETGDTRGQTDHSMGGGPSIGPRTHGVPHSSNIDMVVLSDDGRMALTRDSLGGLRLWPSLGGDGEPVLVPVRGARQVSVATSASGTIISAIDSIGALHILRAQADGSMEELYMSSPHTPMVQAMVLRDGKQLVTLSKDYRLALIEINGAVLSELQQRRFHPSSIRLAQDSGQVIAIESDATTAGGEVTLKTVDIDLDKKTLALVTGERSLSNVFNVADKRFDLSPNGTHVAYLGTQPAVTETGAHASEAKRKPNRPPMPTPANVAAQGLLIANLETGAVQSVDLPLPPHEVLSVNVAFSSDSEVIVASRPTGGSWKVTLGETPTSTPLTASVANDSQRSASDVASGMRVAADGTWLFVQDVANKSHHYLGYGAFDPQFASISPNGERVAWSTGAMVFVESVNEQSKSIRITAPPTEAYFRAAFVDDTHVVTVDYSGGLHLIDWEKGVEIANLDTGGPVREFEVDQKRKLIRGIRQNGGAWLAEVGDSGLVGPHLIQDGGYRSGFLAGDQGLWSINASNQLRTYNLREIRKGLNTGELASKATDISRMLPTAVDAKGQHYVVRAETRSAKLTIYVPGESATRELKLDASPSKLIPSPDGTKLALVSGSAATVQVVSAEDARSLWSRSFLQGVRHLSWSADSKSLAVASQVGAIVQDAETGEPSRLGCAPWFEKRDTPPPSTVSFLQVQNLCERNAGQ